MGWQTRVELCNQLFTVENLSDADAFCAEFNIDAENCYENAVSPSAVHTPILEDFMETVAVRVRANSPMMGELPPPGQPDEVADVIAFLCSDDSRRVNGVNIPVGGGLLAARIGQQFGFGL